MPVALINSLFTSDIATCKRIAERKLRRPEESAENRIRSNGDGVPCTALSCDRKGNCDVLCVSPCLVLRICLQTAFLSTRLKRSHDIPQRYVILAMTGLACINCDDPTRTHAGSEQGRAQMRKCAESCKSGQSGVNKVPRKLTIG